MRYDFTIPEDANEEWRVVPSFILYEASDYGRVRREKTKRIISQHFNKAGYPSVTLSINGKVYVRPVHSLVAEAFIGPRPQNMFVRHLDGDRANNVIDNLQYAIGYNQRGRQPVPRHEPEMRPGWYVMINSQIDSAFDLTDYGRDAALRQFSALHDSEIEIADAGVFVQDFGPYCYQVLQDSYAIKTVYVWFIEDTTSIGAKTERAETGAAPTKEEVEFDEANY